MVDALEDFPLPENEFTGGSGVATGKLAGYLNALWGWAVDLFVGKWKDQQGSVIQAAAQSTMTIEDYRDTNFRAAFFRHDQNDAPSFSFQFQHDYDRGTVQPHVHLIPMAASSGDVVFDLSYVWSNTGEEVPAAASWSSKRVVASFVAADQHKHKVVGFGDFDPPASAKESSFLLLVVQRTGTDAADTYTGAKSPGTGAANLMLQGVDVHYQTNKLGTNSPIPT